ncbi:MAG: ABC transporter ATP-binding protein [Planctomycetes bacterium]|nr:ABC transporter ATP-binding protein [Planctomycetota bacterium]
MTPIFTARNIHKRYVEGTTTLHVVRGIDLDVQPGEILAIVGPSGAGKSTLLHILGLLDRPAEGSLRFRDTVLTDLSAGRQASFRNEKFGFVFQFYHLIPELTAVENAMLPRMIASPLLCWPGRRSKARADAVQWLTRLGLGERLRHRPGQLSGGERQRVAIARALCNDPEIVFCDEPTGNLDTATSLQIQELLWGMNRDLGKSFVIVTHDERIATRAHRVLHMVDGMFVGAPGLSESTPLLTPLQGPG